MKNKIVIFILIIFSINVYSSCIEDIYKSQIGVKEKTGKNDGIIIEMYLKSVNLISGNSWCSAFVYWCFEQCGIKTKINGWSPTAHNPKNIVYFKHELNKQPKPGDVFCLYSVSKKRIAHTGFFHRLNDNIVTTVEGNTSSNGVISGSALDIDGQGVYMKKRPLKTIYSITRWTE